MKNTAERKVKSIQELLETKEESKGQFGDLTRPGYPMEIGSRHPISLVKNQILDVFSTIGFNVSEGPEIEDDWHNFTALNLPEYHPARDMQDTFLSRQIQIFYYVRIHHLFKYVTWKTINHLFVRFLQVEFLEMKRYQRVHIVYFTK